MLPPEYLEDLDNGQKAQKPGGSSSLVLWLVVFGLCVLLLGLYFVPVTIVEYDLPLETDLAHMQETLATTPTADPGEDALNTQLLEIRSNVLALEPISAQIAREHVDWPTLIRTISTYEYWQLRLTGIVQSNNVITLNGKAIDETVVTAYANMLRESGHFGAVVVQSIILRSLATPSTATQDEAASSTANDKYAEFTILLELKAEQP
jgi:hypothetical protein